jgi:hypothetical protein
MPTGSLLTTSPTATSSLLLGSAMYVFLDATGAFLCGVEPRGIVDNEGRGARDQVDIDVDEREGPRTECEYVEESEKRGDPLRLLCPVCARELKGVPEGRLTGVEVDAERLVVRCRDANVEPCKENPSGPDTDRLVDMLDIWLDGRLWSSVDPETARLGLGREGTRKRLREDEDSAERSV